MSVRQMALVWEHIFPPHEQRTMLCLTDHADDHGRNIFPSMAYIAWKLGCSERQAQRNMKALRDKGVIFIYKQATRYRPHEYGIDWEKAKKKPKYRGDADDVGGDAGMTPVTLRGDVAVSPKPSVNHHKDSPTKNKPKSKYVLAMEELEDHFCSLSKIPNGWEGSPATAQKRWRTPCKNMWNALDKDTDKAKKLMTKAYRQMRKDKLTISAPGSIENVFSSLIGEQTQENPNVRDMER